MKRTIVEDAMFPGCPVRNILARICDKWALLVLCLLERSEQGKLRFSELKQAMPDISQKMLAMTLRTLEEDGYVSRTLYAEVPPRVEYALTARARRCVRFSKSCSPGPWRIGMPSCGIAGGPMRRKTKTNG